MGFINKLLKLFDKISISFGYTENINQSSESTTPTQKFYNTNNINVFTYVKDNKAVQIYFVPDEITDINSGDEFKVVVGAKDESGNPVQKIHIKIGLNKDQVILFGQTEGATDYNGYAKFENLIIHKTGTYKLMASYNEQIIYTNPFHVYAPCSDINFQKYPSGSTEERDAFLTAILNKKKPNDIIKYNGKEI